MPGRYASTWESFTGSSKKRPMSSTKMLQAVPMRAKGCLHQTNGLYKNEPRFCRTTRTPNVELRCACLRHSASLLALIISSTFFVSSSPSLPECSKMAGAGDEPSVFSPMHDPELVGAGGGNCRSLLPAADDAPKKPENAEASVPIAVGDSPGCAAFGDASLLAADVGGGADATTGEFASE